jgi:hypothetical protein
MAGFLRRAVADQKDLEKELKLDWSLEGRTLLLLSEVVGVDAFDLIRGRHCYADIVLNQHKRESGAVDQDEALFDSIDVVPSVLAERASCDEDTFPRTETVEAARKALHHRSPDGSSQRLAWM